MPQCELGSWGITLDSEAWPAEALQRRLRQASPPVIARIEADRVVVDLRTVTLDEEADLIHAIKSVV